MSAALAFTAAALRITMPYLLAALGGTFAERAGVIHLALEGLLLGSAFGATAGALAGGSALAGVAGGLAVALLLSLLYALLVLRLGADQVVTGIALNLMVDGGTRFFLKALYGSSSNSPRAAAWGSRGAGLADTLGDPLVVAALVALVVSIVVMRRTRFGLRVRAVGEHPEAAATLGVSSLRVRLGALLVAGVLAGLAGVFLAADQRQFVGGMSGGRGYIAIAAMIFGGWRPGGAALAALVFGLAETVQVTLAAVGQGRVPEWLTQMIPYGMTLLALCVPAGRFSRFSRTPPKSLGKPYGKQLGRGG
jgi:simple sugar transport system permease protein